MKKQILLLALVAFQCHAMVVDTVEGASKTIKLLEVKKTRSVSRRTDTERELSDITKKYEEAQSSTQKARLVRNLITQEKNAVIADEGVKSIENQLSLYKQIKTLLEERDALEAQLINLGGENAAHIVKLERKLAQQKNLLEEQQQVQRANRSVWEKIRSWWGRRSQVETE